MKKFVRSHRFRLFCSFSLARDFCEPKKNFRCVSHIHSHATGTHTYTHAHVDACEAREKRSTNSMEWQSAIDCFVGNVGVVSTPTVDASKVVALFVVFSLIDLMLALLFRGGIVLWREQVWAEVEQPQHQGTQRRRKIRQPQQKEHETCTVRRFCYIFEQDKTRRWYELNDERILASWSERNA